MYVIHSGHICLLPQPSTNFSLSLPNLHPSSILVVKVADAYPVGLGPRCLGEPRVRKEQGEKEEETLEKQNIC